MTRSHWLSVFVALFVMLATANSGHAQNAVPPADVTNPASDAGIPALLTGVNSVIRPEDVASITFDALLDPSNGSDPSRLTAGAQSIINNHLVAQQQVELAIRYLLANREEIVAGNNKFFNQIYGKSTTKQKVAILAPVSLPGTFTLRSTTLLRSAPQAQGGGGGGGGGNNQPQISVSRLLRPGDSVFLIDPTAGLNNNNNNNNNNNANVVRTTYPNQSTLGYVVKIGGVIVGGLNNAGGNNQNNQNNAATDFVISPPASNVPAASLANLTNATAWRIIRFEDRNDSTAYDQVLATFMATRDALAGFNPALQRAIQTRRDITYNRQYTPIRAVAGNQNNGFNISYRPGDADFSQLDGLVNQRVPGYGFVADRLLRQAGFSVSDSAYHLDTLYNLANAQPLDYQARPVTPLLWTSDTDIPLQFGKNTQVPGTTNEDLAFFHDRETIFGARDNFVGANANLQPVEQYIGRAFLEEQILHAGGFFDYSSIAASNLDEQVRDKYLPSRGTQQFTPASANAAAVPISDGLQPVPESGDPTKGKTLRKWQMILESFAEWNPNLNNSALTNINNPNIKNVAAIGLMDITGGTGSPILRSRDAGNFAEFADLIGGAGGGIDFSRIEPLGKRGGAGFNPVVPSN